MPASMKTIEAGDDLAVERQRVHPAQILLRKPVQRLAREGGAEAVDGHRRALAALPAGRLERQERFGAEAHLFGGAGDLVLELAHVAQPAPEPLEFAHMMRLQRRLQIGLSVEIAFEERPLHLAGGDQGEAEILGDHAEQARHRSVEPHFRQHQHLGQLQMRPRQHVEEVLDDAGRIVAVDQRRAERAERARPCPHDRHAERRRRALHRERHQQAQPAALLVAVADHRQSNLAVFEARHRRRQETRVEEDVGLDGAGAQMLELLDHVEAGRGRIDGEPAFGPAAFEKLDMRLVAHPRGETGQFGDHCAGRAAAHLLEQGYRHHQRTAFSAGAGMKIAMTMPSLRQTVKLSAVASNTIAIAVARAAPHRPSIGIRTMASTTLRASVSA